MITLWILFGATGRWLLFLYSLAVEKIVGEMWPLLELESRNSGCKRLVGDTKYCEASGVVCLGNFWGSRVIVSVRGQKLLALDCCRVGLSALACAMAGSLYVTRRVGKADAEVDQGCRLVRAPAEVWQELVCGCGSGASPFWLAMPWLGKLSLEQNRGKCLVRWRASHWEWLIWNGR
jgi:hypothetical protein